MSSGRILAVESSCDETAVAVVERGAERFEHSAEQALGGNDTPTEQLRALVGSHVDVVLDHTDDVG